MSKQNPQHYRQGSIEPWDFIVSQNLGFLEGNVIKYITRAGKKDNESKFDDLLKAQAYIHKLVLTTIQHDATTANPTDASDQVQRSNGSTYRELFPEWYEDPIEPNI
jgi:hypothetical protein